MGEEREVLESLLLEMRRGTLVLGVLSQLDKPQYGYALVQRMESRGVPIDPNTLYPLLRRLEKQGCFETYSREYGGRLRKYYRMTPLGFDRLRESREQLKEVSRVIDYIMQEEGKGDKKA